jgi:hypothetical protein
MVKVLANTAGLITPLLSKGGGVLRRTKLILAVLAAMAMFLPVVAAPALADDFHKDFKDFDDEEVEIFDDDFDDLDDFGFFLVSDVEVDVDEEEVGHRNDDEGECFVEEVDLDLDGFIAEWEVDVVCFV